MSILRSTIAPLFVLALLGCPKENAPDAKKPTPTPIPTAGGPQTAGQGKMAHCPSMVQGADTAIGDAPDALVVMVTAPSDNKAAVDEIRMRSKHLAEVSVKNPATVKHDGEGDGGGGLGNCPIVLADTTITVEDVPNGSKLTVKPSKAEDLPRLKQAANDRKAKLAMPKTAVQ